MRPTPIDRRMLEKEYINFGMSQSSCSSSFYRDTPFFYFLQTRKPFFAIYVHL